MGRTGDGVLIVEESKGQSDRVRILTFARCGTISCINTKDFDETLEKKYVGKLLYRVKQPRIDSASSSTCVQQQRQQAISGGSDSNREAVEKKGRRFKQKW